MNVKVTIYSEKSVGAPLNVLIDPVYGEVNDISELTPLISSALNEASAYISNQEIITLVDSYSISRWMDVINIQEYLRAQGLVLMVAEITGDKIEVGDSGMFIEIVSPKLENLPVATTYYDESGQYDAASIVEDIVNKFNIGDPSLIPESTLLSTLAAVKDMQSKGMSIFPMYYEQLWNELINYGFQLYYVYIS